MVMNFLISMMVLFSGPERIHLANKFTHQKLYEESNAILDTVVVTAQNASEYNALRMYNYFALQDRARAQIAAVAILDSFEPVPRRYTVMAERILYEMESWTTGDLAEIERDMRQVADRLETAKGGEKTQKIQKDIIAKLDKLIKDQEDKNNQGNGDQSADKNGPQKPGNGGQSQPAPESIIMGGKGGDGKVDEKKLRDIAASWGTMPPAKRAKVINEITRDLPDKFRPMIEAYFEALNKYYKK